MHSTIPNINSSTLIFVIPEEEWRNLHDTLKQIMDLIARRNADDANSEWIESEDARKNPRSLSKDLAKLSRQTHHSLLADRPQNYINSADFDAFLRKHRIPLQNSKFFNGNRLRFTA